MNHKISKFLAIEIALVSVMSCKAENQAVDSSKKPRNGLSAGKEDLLRKLDPRMGGLSIDQCPKDKKTEIQITGDLTISEPCAFGNISSSQPQNPSSLTEISLNLIGKKKNQSISSISFNFTINFERPVMPGNGTQFTTPVELIKRFGANQSNDGMGPFGSNPYIEPSISYYDTADENNPVFDVYAALDEFKVSEALNAAGGQTGPAFDQALNQGNNNGQRMDQQSGEILDSIQDLNQQAFGGKARNTYSNGVGGSIQFNEPFKQGGSTGPVGSSEMANAVSIYYASFTSDLNITRGPLMGKRIRITGRNVPMNLPNSN